MSSSPANAIGSGSSVGRRNVVRAHVRRLLVDGAGNLLDNSVIYVTSCVGLPWEHRFSDFPLLVAGKGGGLLRGDVHIRAQGDNTSKVPFQLLQMLGSTEPSFGQDEGLVTEGVPELLA